MFFIWTILIILIIIKLCMIYKFQQFIKNLQIGKIYKIEINPFDIREYQIVDIKQNYVRYQIYKNSIYINTNMCSVYNFYQWYIKE